MRIHFATDTIWKSNFSEAHPAWPGTDWAQTRLGPWCPLGLSAAPSFCGCFAMASSPSWTCVQQAQTLGSGGLSMGVWTQQALQWVSLGTQKAGGRWFNEGGPSSMVYCMLALGSRLGLELKGKWVQLLAAKPCSRESSKIQDTAPRALHGASTAQGLSRWVNPPGSLSQAPEGTQTPPWLRHTWEQHSSAQGAALMHELPWIRAAFHQA